jgi:hypothetical protein
MANNNNDNYPDWHGYMQNLTTAEQQRQQQQNNMFLMQSNAQQQQQQQQQQYQYRKFSMGAPVPSFASKRLDILEKSNSRLTPSYSNPDLSSARRMGSLDAGLRLRRYESNDSGDDFNNIMMDNNSLQQQQQYMSTGRHHSLFNTSIYNNLPSMVTSTPSPTLISSHSVAAANPLLVSHYMRKISSNSRPPSPPLASSRKNSMVVQQQQLRRTSSATTMNVSPNNNDQDKFAFIQLEDVVDEIYALCKDQYGCRFFQKKLEEQKPDQRDIIFVQIYPHFVELMTGILNIVLLKK